MLLKKVQYGWKEPRSDYRNELSSNQIYPQMILYDLGHIVCGYPVSNCTLAHTSMNSEETPEYMQMEQYEFAIPSY